MTQDSHADAVVIGSGPNGLVAANLLADAGWRVVVLEAQPRYGGAVASDGDVHPGFVHDTCSSFYPLAAASPTIRGLGLEQFGLVWTHAPAVVGTPFRDGAWAVLHRDRTRTAASLEARCPGDGDAWLELCAGWDRIGEDVVAALLSPFPPLRAGLRAALHLPAAGGLDLMRELLAPARTLVTQRFGGTAAQVLVAANAAHADVPMDAPGSGLFGWLLAMTGQHLGFPAPVGGAGALARAMADRLTGAGGEIRLSTRASRVVVRDGRAVAVRTEDGDVVEARQAVVADVSAPALYGGLVAAEDLPARVLRRIRRFEWDPGTIKVDWALGGPVPWAHPPEEPVGTVHLAESVDEIAVAQAQIASGAVPDEPFLLVGQMATADPTRAPGNGEALWAYTHVPQRTVSDAGDGSVTGAWDHDDTERMADRMQRRIEAHAPGFKDLVLARRVLGPRELEARDENLVNGALSGGTAGLHQQLVLRPVPGLGRAETPVRGLYLGSASAHPGGGVHGACGANAARAALVHARVRTVVRR